MENLAQRGQQPSSVFKAPGFRLEYIAVDAMHSADLGVFQVALGSLLWVEIAHKPWHRTQADGVKWLNQELKYYYQANRSKKLSEVFLTKSMIKSEDVGFPLLRAKAAQTRHLAEFGLYLALLHEYGDASRPSFRFPDHGRLGGRSRERCRLQSEVFQGMVSFLDSLDRVPFCPGECKRAAYQFLQAFESLRRLWRTDLENPERSLGLPWHMLPKGHLLQHLVEDKLQLWGSPKSFWCYSDESFVGSIKNVAAGSRHPATLESIVSKKCMLVAGLDEYELAHGRSGFCGSPCLGRGRDLPMDWANIS